MAQHVQEPQATVSQTGKRRRISARIWRFLLLIAALIIIVVFVLASLGDFPTLLGMSPVVFAGILSGCIGILSLLVGIIPFIHDDVQQNVNTRPATVNIIMLMILNQFENLLDWGTGYETLYSGTKCICTSD